MTPPLHISKFTSCWNKANSVVERKAVRNAAYSDQGCFKQTCRFLSPSGHFLFPSFD